MKSEKTITSAKAYSPQIQDTDGITKRQLIIFNAKAQYRILELKKDQRLCTDAFLKFYFKRGYIYLLSSMFLQSWCSASLANALTHLQQPFLKWEANKLNETRLY